MPTYQYFCAKCELEFEHIQPITAKPLDVCPKDMCGQKKWGKGKVKRMIGAGAGLIFKGTGFYITDYRSDKYKEAAKKDSPSSATSSGSETKSAAKSDAKPAKTESKPAAKST